MASINIQRGRDHGLPDYNQRTAVGDRFFYLWDPYFASTNSNIATTVAATSVIDSVIDRGQINLGNILRWNTDVVPARDGVFFTVAAPCTLVLLFSLTLIGLLSRHRGNRHRREYLVDAGQLGCDLLRAGDA